MRSRSHRESQPGGVRRPGRGPCGGPASSRWDLSIPRGFEGGETAGVRVHHRALGRAAVRLWRSGPARLRAETRSIACYWRALGRAAVRLWSGPLYYERYTVNRVLPSPWQGGCAPRRSGPAAFERQHGQSRVTGERHGGHREAKRLARSWLRVSAGGIGCGYAAL